MITVQQQRDSAGRLTPDAASNPAANQGIAPDDFVARLRKEFPHWGILPGAEGVSWVAVQGKNLQIEGVNGIDLYDKLTLASARYGCQK